MSFQQGAPDKFDGGSSTDDERMWGMLAHLSPLVLGFLGPLIIWMVKKDESPFIAEQAKSALNFSLTMMIISLISMITCVGPLVVAVYALVMHIMAGLEANKGLRYEYPFSWQLIS
ncbi:MAG TPA: DUF4870 domain-containing protein [Planctomycetaceae bacterium]|nr:orotate phosphoribosyltransferase [Blastopirellula sp.]HAY78533.1 DUF4870 domain-containing protein [Planctomycetaceae bacterium]